MPRRNRPEKRLILPDARFNSREMQQFINKVMTRGKKSTAEGIVYGAFDLVAERAKDDPLKVWERALGNVRPHEGHAT